MCKCHKNRRKSEQGRKNDFVLLGKYPSTYKCITKTLRDFCGSYTKNTFSSYLEGKGGTDYEWVVSQGVKVFVRHLKVLVKKI